MKNNENKGMRFRYSPEKNISIAFVDFLLVVAGFMMTAVMLTGSLQRATQLSLTEISVLLLHGAFAVLFFWGFEMYSAILLKPNPVVVTAILSAIYTFICTFFVVFVFTRSVDYLLFLAVGSLVSFTILCVWHIALYYYFKKWSHRPKMLMVERLTDDNSRVRRLKYECMTHYDAWYEHVNTDDKACVQEFIEKILPDYDVICLMETIPFDVRNMFMQAGLQMNKEFYVVPMAYEMNFAKVKLSYLDDVMVFHLRPTRISAVNLALKRMMDIAISFAALAVACIPMCIIALLIKLTSPGPVFYLHHRIGENGRPLPLLKFRTMYLHAEEKISCFTPEQKAEWEANFKLESDPRVTRIGRFLRRSSLDELPQLFNVLKGERGIIETTKKNIGFSRVVAVNSIS
jgi:lipopolysaccharide/colanic/teichoic acid biosynthesis glycosyltransferase